MGCQAENGEESCIPWVPVWKESRDPGPVFQSIWFLCGLMGTLNGRHYVPSLGITFLCGEADDEQYLGTDTAIIVSRADCSCREESVWREKQSQCSPQELAVRSFPSAGPDFLSSRQRIGFVDCNTQVRKCFCKWTLPC